MPIAGPRPGRPVASVEGNSEVRGRGLQELLYALTRKVPPTLRWMNAAIAKRMQTHRGWKGSDGLEFDGRPSNSTAEVLAELAPGYGCLPAVLIPKLVQWQRNNPPD